MSEYRTYLTDGIWEDWDSGDTVFSGEFEGERWVAGICKDCRNISDFHKDKLNHWIKGNCDCVMECWNNGHIHNCKDKVDGFALRLQDFINKMESEKKANGTFGFASGPLVVGVPRL